jgi:hypothetical protein
LVLYKLCSEADAMYEKDIRIRLALISRRKACPTCSSMSSKVRIATMPRLNASYDSL